MKHPLPTKEFFSIYKKVTRLCVEIIIKTSKGVLLSKRAIQPAKGRWHFPGGTVYFGETLKRAVQRIALQETGLHVSVKKLLGTIEAYKRDGFGWPISIAFLVTPRGGTLKGDWQTTELRFFKKIPKGTVKRHAEFLRKTNLIR